MTMAVRQIITTDPRTTTIITVFSIVRFGGKGGGLLADKKSVKKKY